MFGEILRSTLLQWAEKRKFQPDSRKPGVTDPSLSGLCLLFESTYSVEEESMVFIRIFQLTKTPKCVNRICYQSGRLSQKCAENSAFKDLPNTPSFQNLARVACNSQKRSGTTLLEIISSNAPRKLIFSTKLYYLRIRQEKCR